MATLILLRHAKSDYPPGVPDRERPLAERGVRDARAAGEWLAAAFPVIDEVLVSPAVRAERTWSLAGSAITPVRVSTDDRIYADWGAGLREVVGDLPATAETALIVGHNPGIEELAAALAADGDRRALDRLRAKYPTSGIAVLRMPAGWQGAGDLAAFAVPRG